MQGWNGLPGFGGLNTGPGGWPGYTANMPVPAVPQAGASTLSPSLNAGLGFAPMQSGDAAAGAAFGNGNGYGSPGMFGIEGLGMNIDTMKLGLGGLQSLAGIWNAMEQNKMAKKSFNLNEGILNTNMANQIKSYNMTVDDRLRSRQVVEGTSDAAREEARKRWEARDERRG